MEDHPLNTSDYLPIISKLNLKALRLSSTSSNMCSPLDWERARNDGSILSYTSLSNSLVDPLLEKDYSSIHEIESDISLVCKSLVSAAASTIPHFRPSNHGARRHVKDTFLSSLCWHSREAFRQWKAAGCPRSGPVYEKRKKCKRDVSSYLSKCRARVERISIPRNVMKLFNLITPNVSNVTPRRTGAQASW